MDSVIFTIDSIVFTTTVIFTTENHMCTNSSRTSQFKDQLYILLVLFLWRILNSKLTLSNSDKMHNSLQSPTWHIYIYTFTYFIIVCVHNFIYIYIYTPGSVRIYVYCIIIYIYIYAHTHIYVHSQLTLAVKTRLPMQIKQKRRRFDPYVRKIHWRRAWQAIPVFLPGESHWQRSLAG